MVVFPFWSFSLVVIVSSLHFDQAASMIPHPAKAEYGGEDAFFSSKQLLVIADGVGGWRNKGIDSGIFSRQLCLNARKLFYQDHQLYSTNPKKLIIDSQQRNLHKGSSTMVVLSLTRTQLKSSYIGDSRYLLIRDRQIIFEAAEQQHSFNFPFQLASPQSKYGTNPNNSLQFIHQIQNHDLIVVGSDGLFDNIFPRQIMEIIYKKGQFKRNRLLNKGQLANHLCSHAMAMGKQLKYTSPFAINAHRHQKLWRGGKLDDTTVIVAEIILDDQDSSDQSSSSSSSSSSESIKTKSTQNQNEL